MPRRSPRDWPRTSGDTPNLSRATRSERVGAGAVPVLDVVGVEQRQLADLSSSLGNDVGHAQVHPKRMTGARLNIGVALCHLGIELG